MDRGVPSNGRGELGILCSQVPAHYTCSHRVLSEGGLRQVKAYIVNSRATPKHDLKSSVSNTPREGIMESHKTHNEIQRKHKYRSTKKQRTDAVNRNSAVANMVPVNPIISISTSTENGIRIAAKTRLSERTTEKANYSCLWNITLNVNTPTAEK